MTDYIDDKESLLVCNKESSGFCAACEDIKQLMMNYKSVAVLDEHTCSYCSQRDGLEIKDGHCPPYPDNTNEEEPYNGCASESGCRCVVTRKD